MIAGIELGGTKTVVAIGDNDGSLGEQFRFPTTTPGETLGQAVEWVLDQGLIDSLGIAAFGPVGINREATSYGKMLPTPKEGWSDFDLLALLSKELPDAPIILETDVNAAVLAEVTMGAATGCSNVAYITIGTGIGGGLIVDGNILHGSLHSEFGHLNVPRHPDDDFAGLCPYHSTCLEGLASGPAISKRWGTPGHKLPADHPAWDMEAWYLAQGTLSLLAIASPSRVIIGGGASQAEGFHDKVEAHLRRLSAGYFSTLEENQPYVVPPSLEQDAGIQGALLLASRASIAEG
ncbi:MAG: ROK family protein [Akkermansiaceae bacterium]|nr:ROK family protein [Akkermansiaceae bacterium]